MYPVARSVIANKCLNPALSPGERNYSFLELQSRLRSMLVCWLGAISSLTFSLFLSLSRTHTHIHTLSRTLSPNTLMFFLPYQQKFSQRLALMWLRVDIKAIGSGLFAPPRLESISEKLFRSKSNQRFVRNL